MSKIRLQSLFAVAMLALATPLLAQKYPFPGSKLAPPVLCTGCTGNNTQGQPNNGKPTYPYDTPLLAHVGRLVDSTTTTNIQNWGIRTVRAGRMRMVPSRNRIYVQLGEAVGVYALDTFISGELAQPLQPVDQIYTGVSYNGRPSFEKVHVPDGFFYAESPFSGWTTSLIDSQKHLWDFDADDRGYVYVSTIYFGWGIARENEDQLGYHLPFVANVRDNGPENIFVVRNGTSYYAVLGSATTALQLYDVTIPASPVLVATRNGNQHALRSWAKNEKDARLAVLNGDGAVRVYTNAAYAAGNAPLATLTPQTGRAFTALSFDDAGNVWVTDRASTSAFDTNMLWKLAPSGNGYTPSSLPIAGGGFRSLVVHAGAGYVAVAGHDEGGGYDVRLFRVNATGLEPISTDGFFKKYYSVSPAGYAIPEWKYVAPQDLRFLAQGENTYFIYNAGGLGDAYRITAASASVTSIAPVSGPPGGGTTVILNTVNVNVTGNASVTFDGVAGTNTTVEPGRIITTTPPHAPGAVTVQVVAGGVTLNAPQQFTYLLDPPTHFDAVGASATSIALTWDAVEGATEYELARRNADGTWTSLGKTPNRAYNDLAALTGAAYVYRVRALDRFGYGSGYATDTATTVPFTATSVAPGTKIRSALMTELQTAVNAYRAAAGLPAATFSMTSFVRAADILALRTALAEARTILGLSSIFTDASLAGTPVKAAHVQELLDAVR